MSVDLRPPSYTPAPRSRMWLGAGALVTAAVVAAAVVGTWFWIDTGDSEPRNLSENTQYQQKVTRVEVDLSAGHLVLSSGQQDGVSADRQLLWEKTKPVVTEEWRGETLHIRSTCPGDAENCSVNYTLRVPAAVAVQARTGAGDLTVTGVSGEVRLTAQAGNVTLNDVSGRTTVRTDAGNISGNGLAAKGVDTATEGGDIDLTFSAVPDSVNAVSDAGAVRVAVPRAGSGAEGYQVQAESKAGDRNVSVMQDSSGTHTIVARSEAGDVTVAYA